ncbi:GlxA family transcriptional regulator [Pseudoalteromonas denitrificans]|uniref:Transcriptional regulator, AraC family with amidase-like domain n=1 Tax=Pseudoalteromonas denitrificans DSM 6059 TaxID=1123010 RepID=A0A1I1KL79_9GAMM|nr:helix-turn-helix domain-containing protein [Pseudoalteromonas denitrificans]SFC61335.1 transcriptional regulator, AraC family with amidase-like domain [Pseudoalteromonas denitrificans DSM 6059]
MQNSNQKSPIKVKVSLLVYQHMLATSLTLPVEMLRAGEAFALSHNKDSKVLSIQLVGESLEPIASRAGISILADCIADNADIPELIIVPSIWRNPRPVLRKHPNLIQWLKKQWSEGCTLIGVGTGNCFLAESGLLDGLPATIHWHYAEQFRRDYPLVDLKPDFFITQSDRIYCAASLNSLADIIVHIIHQFYGTEAAQHVERNFSHEIRKPYEEQRYLAGAVDRHPDELIAQIQFWMRTNLSSTLDLSQVAAQFGVSQRSFTRRFKAATGTKATDYWQQLRIETVKDLLSSSNLSIQEIAFEVGYSDQGYLTRLFKKHLGQTPKQYRALVRKKLFS